MSRMKFLLTEGMLEKEISIFPLAVDTFPQQIIISPQNMKNTMSPLAVTVYTGNPMSSPV